MPALHTPAYAQRAAHVVELVDGARLESVEMVVSVDVQTDPEPLCELARIGAIQFVQFARAEADQQS